MKCFISVLALMPFSVSMLSCWEIDYSSGFTKTELVLFVISVTSIYSTWLVPLSLRLDILFVPISLKSLMFESVYGAVKTIKRLLGFDFGEVSGSWTW